jgi:hypothetical protein
MAGFLKKYGGVHPSMIPNLVPTWPMDRGYFATQLQQRLKIVLHARDTRDMALGVTRSPTDTE